MAAEREELGRWIFGSEEDRRFTQDSPVLPDVWLAYGAEPAESHDLLLTPHADSSAAVLAARLAAELGDQRRGSRLAYSESYVVARLSFEELIRFALPLSAWWSKRLWPSERADNLGAWVKRHSDELQQLLAPEDELKRRTGPTHELAWLVGLVGRISSAVTTGGAEQRENVGEPLSEQARKQLVNAASALLRGLKRPARDAQPSLWSVSLNREARTALWRSREAIKADAAERVFEASCSQLRWAIVDVGVDASHPAFRKRDKDGELIEPFVGEGPGLNTRVVASYDFTRLRGIIAGELPKEDVPSELSQDDLDQIAARLESGRAIDWDLLEPLLRVRYQDGRGPPTHEHGTHVAGVLAGDWRKADLEMPAKHDLVGVCPDIELYDLRVFDERGRSEEFAVTSALQFVRHLNSHSDLQVIHGVNLSLSLAHSVKNYAVGRTPVCDECERLVSNGVCVVSAAGNEGRTGDDTELSLSDGYRTVSITDPGNAERVITVGATHRYSPHTYGISYFSSRGPTGDGRVKPDLVAPGEKINAPVPGANYKEKDGTSQAAPHVSGAAALLMARYEELRGQPQRIKQILCASATDLGRERYFQGAGMLDVLRAMQEV